MARTAAPAAFPSAWRSLGRADCQAPPITVAPGGHAEGVTGNNETCKLCRSHGQSRSIYTYISKKIILKFPQKSVRPEG